MNMYCWNCGTEVQDNVNFCSICGADIKATANSNGLTHGDNELSEQNIGRSFFKGFKDAFIEYKAEQQSINLSAIESLILALSIFIVCIVNDVGLKISLIVGIVSLIVILALWQFRYTSRIVMIICSVGWAFIALILFGFLNIVFGLIMSVLAFICSIALHINAFSYIQKK